MVKFYESLSDDLRDWALEQPLFFIASAPLKGKHINVSPKGVPSSTLYFFDENHLAYVDLTGSGAETISHIYENGRATIMFCSFDSSPRIMRLFCTGKVVEYDRPEFPELLKKMDKPEYPGARAIILLEMWKVQTSCGFAVPLKSKQESVERKSDFDDRDTLATWSSKRIKEGKMEEYRAKMNSRNLDGLPGLKIARRMAGETLWVQDLIDAIKHLLSQPGAILLGAFLTVAVLLLLDRLIPDQTLLQFGRLRLSVSRV